MKNKLVEHRTNIDRKNENIQTQRNIIELIELEIKQMNKKKREKRETIASIKPLDLAKINTNVSNSPDLEVNKDIPLKLDDEFGENVEKLNLLKLQSKQSNSKPNSKGSRRSKKSSIRIQKLEGDSRNAQLKPSNSHQIQKRKKMLEVIDLDEEVSSNEEIKSIKKF